MSERTESPPFHGGVTGSSPVGVTIFNVVPISKKIYSTIYYGYKFYYYYYLYYCWDFVCKLYQK